MSRSGDEWYKRAPRKFLDGVQGMGPELIGAYAVILDILYARDGDMVRDDHHLAGVMGCSKRKAAALTEGLISLGKLRIEGENIVNDAAEALIETRRKQRETEPKRARKVAENRPTFNENNVLSLQKRIEEKEYPQTPTGAGRKNPRFGTSFSEEEFMAKVRSQTDEL